MKKVIINDKEYHVAGMLEAFNIQQKPSSNVEFFGTNSAGSVFVQFKNGNTYIYSNVHAGRIEEMNAAESIGRFVPKLKAYPCEKIDRRLVTPVQDEQPIR
jgi:hypothetical protein